MKNAASILLVMVAGLTAACGSSSSTPSALCAKATKVTADLNKINGFNSNTQQGQATSAATSLKTDVNAALNSATNANPAQVHAAKAAMNGLYTQISTALPGLYNSAQIKSAVTAFETAWKAVTVAEHC